MDFENIKLETRPLKARTGIDVNGRSLADIWGEDISGIKDHNGVARRLVAAWNACEGISTESLENGESIINALREQNAALRAAVKEMERVLPVLDFLEGWRENTWATAIQQAGIDGLDNYRQTLETALAKMESK